MFDLDDCNRVIEICRALKHPAIKDPVNAPALLKTNDKIKSPYSSVSNRINSFYLKKAENEPALDAMTALESLGDLMLERSQSERGKLHSAVEEISKLGYEIWYLVPNEIRFMFNGYIVKFFPNNGWHSGRSIKDGRGIKHLLDQISIVSFPVNVFSTSKVK
jgi:hypothetical protein